MRRFLEHHELARDSRFVRQDNAQANVLSELPDDVDTVVDVFEKFTPMIESSVRGTAAQALFDEYGPGFALTVLNEPLDPDSPASLTRLLLRMARCPTCSPWRRWQSPSRKRRTRTGIRDWSPT